MQGGGGYEGVNLIFYDSMNNVNKCYYLREWIFYEEKIICFMPSSMFYV